MLGPRSARAPASSSQLIASTDDIVAFVRRRAPRRGRPARAPPPSASRASSACSIWRCVSGPQKPSEHSSTMSSFSSARLDAGVGARRLDSRRGTAAAGCAPGATPTASSRMRPSSTSCCTRVWSRVRASDAALAEQVQAAVADVRPVAPGRPAPRRRRSRCAAPRRRPRFCASRRICACAAADARARGTRAGSASLRLRLALERRAEQIDRELRRHLAVQVPAHAVGDHHQQRLAACASGRCGPGSCGARRGGCPGRWRTSSRASSMPRMRSRSGALPRCSGSFSPVQRLLQREHALRPLQVVQAQAPVDGVEQLRGVLAGPGAPRRHQPVLLQPLRRPAAAPPRRGRRTCVAPTE